MYAQHFNFSGLPFSIAPNPRYVYLSQKHREALAHLLYGIGMGGGFVALTGEVGTGKTTLCRCLLEQLPADVEIAIIFNPRLNSKELLASICDELRIPYPRQQASLKLLIDLLNQHLLDVHARGKRTVVLIDEAQNLSFEVLEQIRLLTNLETNDTKLLQIILVGQPELNDLLRRRNLRQLSQRITARYHLRPLSFRETAAYIHHRIAVSGGKNDIFSTLAVAAIYRLSGGIPRVINLICDRALLGAYALGKFTAGYGIVRKAAREVLPAADKRGFISPMTALVASALVLLLGGLVYFGGMTTVDPDVIAEQLVDVFTKPPPEANPPRSAPGQQVAKTQWHPVTPVATAAPNNIPVAPPQIVPPPSFTQLAANPDATRKAAFAQLFSLWGIAVPAEVQDECAFAVKTGLRCLLQKLSWVQLQNLDIPAVLEFELSDGSKRYATLSAMLGTKARLSLGGRSYDFATADILPFWRGEALLLWKPARNDMQVIRPGARKEMVKWLRDELGVPASGNRQDFYDKQLQAAVDAFQQAHGLYPDGVVGTLTLIHLTNKTMDSAVPRLTPTIQSSSP